MRMICAAMFAVATLSAAPVLAEIKQGRVTGAYMNSLYDRLPPFIDLLTKTHGGQAFAAQGSYGIQPPVSPPNWDQNWARLGVRTPGAGNSWPAVDRANITDIFIVTDNFSGPPVYTSQGLDPDPSIGGPIPRAPEPGKAQYWTQEVADIISSHETNTKDTPIYWIYEGWADAGKILEEATGAGSPKQFKAWRERTTTAMNYTGWFDNLLSQTQANFPDQASRIKMIPVARTMVSVMENTPASSITADEWFIDDAPHGSDTLHMLAAMIVYTAMFEEQAPKPSFNGLNIHQTFQDNYDTIAAHVFELR